MRMEDIVRGCLAGYDIRLISEGFLSREVGFIPLVSFMVISTEKMNFLFGGSDEIWVLN